MTRYDFDTITSELEAFYEKALNPTQKQIWFEELHSYDPEKYRQAIRTICKTSQYKPTLSTILETLKKGKVEEPPKEVVPCKACKGTGIVIYRKVINGYPYDYASQCNCQNAIGLDYDGSKCKEKSDYYLAKAVDVFHIGG